MGLLGDCTTASRRSETASTPKTTRAPRLTNAVMQCAAVSTTFGAITVPVHDTTSRVSTIATTAWSPTSSTPTVMAELARPGSPWTVEASPHATSMLASSGGQS